MNKNFKKYICWPISLWLIYCLIYITYKLLTLHQHSSDYMLFNEKIIKLGYPLQMHSITTQDGYILQCQRVQAKGSQIVNTKKPVLVIHGINGGAEPWISHSENNTFPCVLAQHGYDVWVANMRGNYYSRRHVNLDPDKNISFWNFSWQHIADQDLPSIVEYIKNITGQTVNVIGHSQGGSIILAGMAEQNQRLLKNIDKTILLGPIVYIFYHNSYIFGTAHTLLYHPACDYEYFEYIEKVKLTNILCRINYNVARFILGFFTDSNQAELDPEGVCTFLGTFPVGTSIQVYCHWGQLMVNDRFSKYDYGTKQNMQIYGQEQPPEYNLSNIFNDIYLINGNQDLVNTVKGNEKLISQLKNSKLKTLNITTGHLGYILNQDMSFINQVIEYFDKGQQ